jgi:hypothetical protein
VKRTEILMIRQAEDEEPKQAEPQASDA